MTPVNEFTKLGIETSLSMEREFLLRGGELDSASHWEDRIIPWLIRIDQAYTELFDDIHSKTLDDPTLTESPELDEVRRLGAEILEVVIRVVHELDRRVETGVNIGGIEEVRRIRNELRWTLSPESFFDRDEFKNFAEDQLARHDRGKSVPIEDL